MGMGDRGILNVWLSGLERVGLGLGLGLSKMVVSFKLGSGRVFKTFVCVVDESFKGVGMGLVLARDCVWGMGVRVGVMCVVWVCVGGEGVGSMYSGTGSAQRSLLCLLFVLLLIGVCGFCVVLCCGRCCMILHEGRGDCGHLCRHCNCCCRC